jgi:hypothetical protein
MKTLAAAILCGAMLAPAILRAEEDPEPATPPEAGATAPPATPPIEYIPLRGFAFRTPDRLFELALGFNLQLRFTRFDFDQLPNALEDADEFRVRRFKLYFTGYAFDPRLTYRVQLAFENVNNTRLLLDDAWLNYKFMGTRSPRRWASPRRPTAATSSTTTASSSFRSAPWPWTRSSPGATPGRAFSDLSGRGR